MGAQRQPVAGRLAYLEGLRALAALWVVGNHAWLTIYPSVGAPGTPSGVLGRLVNWMVYGHLAVVAFIVLSGYSLAISTERNGDRLPAGVGPFLRRRFVRIVIPYQGALLISTVLASSALRSRTGTHWDSALPATAAGVARHVLLLQDLDQPAQLNHALWSIAIEWHIYLVFPALLWLRRRVGSGAATAVVVVAGVAVSACFDGGLTVWAEANLFGCFALGVAARGLAARQPAVVGPAGSGLVRFALRGATAATVVLVIVLVAVIRRLGPLRAAEQSNTLLEPLAGLAAAALLVSLAGPGLVSGVLRRVLEARALVAIGTFSFSVYLLHAPLLQLIWQWVMGPLGLPQHGGGALVVLLAIGGPGSVAVGWLYFRLVERRCVDHRGRSTNRRSSATGGVRRPGPRR